MSEEILQRGLDKKPEKIGKWDFYNIGATSIKALKKYKIIRDIDYGKAIEGKKVDGIITYQKNVIAIIENKTPQEFNTEAKQNKAIKQELAVAKKLDCPILIATDTKQTIWINVKTGEKILNENKSEVINNWNPSKVTTDSSLVKLIEKIIISIDGSNNQIIAKKFVNPTDLAKQIWQDIWSVSGATPENCLYTFVELFIFKYLSDLKVLQNPENFDYLMDLYGKRDENFALQYYADNIRKKIKDLFPHNPIDNTTIINGTIFVSKEQKSVTGYSTVFKKVLTKFNDYGKLENINYDFKSQLFESFLKESISKKNWGQFFTPLKVIRGIEKMATNEIKIGSVICDPACGVGKFLLEPIKSKLSEFYQITDTAVIPKITIKGFDKGFDKDEQKTIILAKANMLIYFSDLIKENPHLTKEFSALFNDTFNLKTNSILGTLSEPVENEYDLILTNPPYVTSGSSNLKEEISKDTELKNYYKINGMGVEGLFMEWIIRALKPNGKAFVVVPDGLFNRKPDARLRKFIKDECFIDAVISLPLNTFFSTNKKTYILAITKKQKLEQPQVAPVFTYLVSEIGESRDNYRFDIDQDDLNEAVNQFNQFKGAKRHYKTNDKRCKVLAIDWFDDLDSWVIDNCWSKEEKINLGVLKQDEIISVDDFSNLMDEMSNTILSFKEEIQSKNEKKKIEIVYKDFLISDIFDLSQKTNNSKFTKTFVNKNKGSIPVYSATENEHTVGYGYVQDNLDKIKYFENCLTWNIDGSIGNVFFRKERFSLSEKVIPLILFDKYKNSFNFEFLKYEIERQAEKQNFSYTKKAGKSKISNIEIPLPVDYNNEIDLKQQNKVAEQIKLIDELKIKIKEYQQTIKNVIIDTKDNYKYKEVKINDIFEILGEKNLTKTYIESNKGEYPVYSGQIENGGVFGFIKSYKYDEIILTWVTYGNSGNIRKRSGKFNIGRNNCGLRPLDKNIDLNYIKFIAEPIFISNVKGEKQKSLPQSIVKNITIKIPVNKDGNFDTDKQKEIAEKHQKIESIKKAISGELFKIQNAVIEL